MPCDDFTALHARAPVKPWKAALLSGFEPVRSVLFLNIGQSCAPAAEAAPGPEEAPKKAFPWKWLLLGAVVIGVIVYLLIKK